MKKILSAIVALLMVVLFQAGTAQAFGVRAGPIWSQSDAKKKCPQTCQWYGGWNGNWVTTVPGKMSVCGCNKSAEGGPNDANAGTIWSNAEAPAKCPSATKWYGGWNGQWRTTRPSQMSVCGSKENWH